MEQDISGWRLNRAGDNVLFLVGFGSWSERDARAFCVAFRDAVSDFGPEPWGMLGDATDWVINDSSVQDILRDNSRWSVTAGCRAGSYYTGPGALNRLLLYRLAEPDSDNYQFRVHPHRRRAVEALEHCGFPILDEQMNSFFRGEGERI